MLAASRARTGAYGEKDGNPMMRRFLPGIAALLLALALQAIAPGAAVAQGQPLQGVRVVKVIMPEPGEQGQTCGLERQALEQAFFEPLGKRGWGEAASGTGYRLFLRTTTITYVEGTCITYAEAQLLLITRYFGADGQQEQSGKVLIWADGGLYASDTREHAETVKRAMRGLAERLGARWDAVN